VPIRIFSPMQVLCKDGRKKEIRLTRTVKQLGARDCEVSTLGANCHDRGSLTTAICRQGLPRT